MFRIKNVSWYNEIALLLVVVSAFGPYLFGFGLRTDHVVIYSLFLLAILSIVSKKVRLYGPRRSYVFSISVIYIFLLVWCSVSTVYSRITRSPNDIIASFENYVQPVALMVVLGYFTRNVDALELKRLIARVMILIVGLMVLNSVFAYLSSIADLDFIYRYYFGLKDASVEKGLGRMRSMGRYNGIFPQAAEAGMCYDIALLCCLSLFRDAKSYFRLLLILLSTAMVILGGILSVSKIFVLGAPILFVSACILDPRNFVRPKFVIIMVILFFVFLLSWDILSEWSGYSYFTRLFLDVDSSNVIATYTGGRVSDDSNWSYVFGIVTRNSFLGGEGFGAYTPLDAAFVQYYANGGLVGLVMFFGILVILSKACVYNYKLFYHESVFQLLMLILLMGASMGMDLLTANRVSIFFWILYSLLFLLKDRQGKTFSREYLSSARPSLRM
ncbi:hypothetical protein ACFL6U_04215 [Planctomycetota bacterium]